MFSVRSCVRKGFTLALAAQLALSGPMSAIAANSVANEAARATAYTAQIERSLIAIEDGRRQTPRDHWEPQYVVDTVGIDPASLFKFVRDNVAWVPYRGSLRGPVGVLMDRNGNALDMSLLLAELISRAGYQVRLAHGTLPNNTVDELWKRFEANATETRSRMRELSAAAEQEQEAQSELVPSPDREAIVAPQSKPSIPAPADDPAAQNALPPAEQGKPAVRESPP